MSLLGHSIFSSIGSQPPDWQHQDL